MIRSIAISIAASIASVGIAAAIIAVLAYFLIDSDPHVHLVAY
jgi:hypothetical protein